MTSITNIFGIKVFDQFLPYGRVKVESARSTFAITLAEAKEHLRIDSGFTSDDNYITSLIKIAQDIVEKESGILLTEIELTYIADGFKGGYIDLGYNGNNVVHVKYFDNTNTEITLVEDTDYYVSNKDYPFANIRIYPAKDKDFPETFDKPDCVNIKFDAGTSESLQIPEGLKQAMYLIIGRYYEMRNDVISGTVVNQIPLGAQHLINQYKQPTI